MCIWTNMPTYHDWWKTGSGKSDAKRPRPACWKPNVPLPDTTILHAINSCHAARSHQEASNLSLVILGPFRDFTIRAFSIQHTWKSLTVQHGDNMQLHSGVACFNLHQEASNLSLVICTPLRESQSELWAYGTFATVCQYSMDGQHATVHSGVACSC